MNLNILYPIIFNVSVVFTIKYSLSSTICLIFDFHGYTAALLQSNETPSSSLVLEQDVALPCITKAWIYIHQSYLPVGLKHMNSYPRNGRFLCLSFTSSVFLTFCSGVLVANSRPEPNAAALVSCTDGMACSRINVACFRRV